MKNPCEQKKSVSIIQVAAGAGADWLPSGEEWASADVYEDSNRP